MKRLITTLSAIIAILLIASPVVAGAEQIDVVALRLSDPVVYVNGDPLADMTGLTLQLSGGASADGSLTQVFMDLLAGDDDITYAYAQYDENGLAGYLDGMTSAYGISKEVMDQIPIEMLNGMTVGELLAALDNWTLVDDLSALMTDFETNGITYGEPETIEVDLSAGKTSMTYVPVTADLTEFTYSVMDLLENDPIIGNLFISMAAEEGYTSIIDQLKESGFTYTMTGGIATTEDGSSMMLEYDYVIMAEEETVKCDMNMTVDGSMGETQYLTMTMNVYPEGEDESMTMTMNGTISGEDVTLDGSLVTNFAAEKENAEASFTVTYASAAGTGAGTDKLDVTFDIPDQVGMTLSAYSVEETGETHCEMGVQDASTQTDASAYFTFTPAEAADESVLLTGTIDLGINDGMETVSITCPVDVLMTTVETDDYYIAPEDVIDLTMMTEEQMETAQGELSIAMMQALTKVEEAVPSLEGLTASLIGGTGPEEAIEDVTEEAIEDVTEEATEDSQE